MITYVYICNKCDGDIDSRTFEHEYSDFRTADISPVPACPHCGTNKYVTRFFGHNVFSTEKKKDCVPDRFVPINPLHKKGILAVGMRIADEEKEAAETVVQKLVEVTSMEVIESRNPEKDIIADKLNLKQGTLDRTLFDIRQKKMLDELKEGKKISGFFMPLSGDTYN